jgi:hypothetical protein
MNSIAAIMRPRLAAVVVACIGLAATPAFAVIQGSPSSLGGYVVRIVGPYNCSGVAIGRNLVATAAHCAHRGMRVMGFGGDIGIAGVSRSATLDDGRRVSVSGDAAILKLQGSLSASAAPIGDGGGERFVIAGYGTVNESERGAFGSLHEASLVAASSRALVDPNRTGSIGASACFGDSGGPVMRGGLLVGIITRAAHPSPRIACGDLTRWASISVSGAAREEIADAAPRPRNRRTASRQQRNDAADRSFFAWFTEKTETLPASRRSLRRKSAQR